MTAGDILTKLGQLDADVIWQLARVLIPSIIVAVGWKVVSADHNKRETRKERRQLLDRTIELIDAISDDAITMYVSENGSEAAKLSVNMPPRLKRLEALLQVLKLKKGQGDIVVASALRESITMTNLYRAEPRIVVAADDIRLQDIYVQSSLLIQELEQCYQATYQK